MACSSICYGYVIRKHLNEIKGVLLPEELRTELFQSHLITHEEKDVLVTGELKNKSNTEKVGYLLDVVLQKKDTTFLSEFVNTLHKSSHAKHKEVGNLVKEEAGKLCDGQQGFDIEEKVKFLRQVYSNEEWTRQTLLPDDIFFMDIGNDKKFMDYRFKAKILDVVAFEEDNSIMDESCIKAEYQVLPIKVIEEAMLPNDKLMSMIKTDAKPIRERSRSLPNIKCRWKSSRVTQQQSNGNTVNINTSPTQISLSPERQRKVSVNVIRFQIESPECTDPSSNIFSFQEENENINKTKLILCSGDVGIGKSTLLKRLSYKWAMKTSTSLKHFTVVFTIVLTKVNHQSSVIDILKNSQCLPKEEECFECYLKNPNTAGNVLFLIDSCDEIDLPRDTEIWQMIQGKLYPGVNLFVTCRPDTDMYTDLCELNPIIKIRMKGVEDYSIKKYVGEFLKGQDQAIQNIIKQCEMYQFDHNILSRPLYLAMFCLMIHERYASQLTFTRQAIPESVTDLFNAFLRVILKREMIRSTAKQGINTVDMQSTDARIEFHFEKSPLDQSSTIPLHVQHKLYFVGKMSFEFLLMKKYEFTEEELKSYKLNIQVLTSLGLFGIKDNKSVVYFRHKMMQEYMAAVYIADEGFQLKQLCDMFDEANKKTPKQTLWQIFSEIPSSIQMACGLSTKFYQELLCRAEKVAAISRDQYHVCNMQIQYELSLCYEAGYKSAKICTQMEQYLLQAEVIDMPSSQPISAYEKKCIASVTSCLDKGSIKKFLSKWYGIQTDIHGHFQSKDEMAAARILSPSPHNQNNVQRTFELPKGIGFLCLTLLSQFSFPDVTKLVIKGDGGIVDLSRLLTIFPRLKEMDAQVKFNTGTFLDSDLKHKLEEGNFSKSLKSYHQKGSTHHTFSKPSAECLVKQCHLEILSLNGNDILSIFQQLSNDQLPKWGNLRKLSLVWCQINKDNTNILARILKSSPNITDLDLSENNKIDTKALCTGLCYLHKLSNLNLSNIGLNETNTAGLCEAFQSTPNITVLNLSDNSGLNIEVMCRGLKDRLLKLQELRLFRSLDPEKSEALAKALPHFAKLSVLGLFSTDIVGAEETICNSLLQCENFNEIEVQEAEWGYETAFKAALKERLRSKGIRVQELSVQ